MPDEIQPGDGQPTPSPSNEIFPPQPPLDSAQSNADSVEDLTGISDERLYAALSYLTFLVFVPLLTRKNDPFINFHVRQGLIMLVAFIIAAITAVWINVIGSTLFLLLLIADIIALVLTLQGRSWRIPGIGHIAEKIKI